VFHSSCGRPVRGVLPLPTGPEVLAQQRLVVDWTRCQGHGLCAHLVPEIVHLDSNGFPVMLDIPVPDWLAKDAQQAVDMCPALALRLASVPPKLSRASTPVPLPMPVGRTALIGGGPPDPGGRGGPRQITA
jgi:ferredoxin